LAHYPLARKSKQAVIKMEVKMQKVCYVIVGLICLSGFVAGQEPKPTPRPEISHGRHGAFIKAVAYSPDGKQVASLDAYRIKVTDVASGKQLYEIKNTKDFTFSALAYAPGGKTLAVGQNLIKIKRTRQGQYNLTETTWFGNLLMCDAETGKVQAKWSDHDNPVWALAYSRDGKWLGIATGPTQSAETCQENCVAGEVTLANATSGQIVHRLRGNATAMQSVVFSADSQMVAGGGSGLQNRHVDRPDDADPLEAFVWKVETGELLQRLTGQRTTITSLAFSPDGKWLATSARDRSLKIWNTQSWKLEREASDYLISYDEILTAEEAKKAKDRIPPQSWLSGIVFSPDSQLIIGGGGDALVRIYDVKTAKLKRFFKPRGWPIVPLVPMFRTYSVDEYGNVSGVPTMTAGPTLGTELARMTRSLSVLNSIALSPDRKTLALGTADGKIRLVAWE
jgi:WD40 repeat protein